MANTNPSRAKSTATFALLFVAAATLLQLLAPATSSAMAEDVRYQWSGTMTVSREVDGPDAGNSYSMTGNVVAGEYSSYYYPSFTRYSYWAQRDDEWCRTSWTLRAADPADTALPVFVEWGRTRSDGSFAVPRIMTASNLEFGFPRHRVDCVASAATNWELKQIVQDDEAPFHLEDAFNCSSEYPYAIPPDVPFGTSDLTPPALPARTVDASGNLHFAGTVTSPCSFTSVGATSDSLTLTVDLTGTPVRAPVDIVEVYHPLTVGVNGPQYGSIYGLEGAISCGLGQLLCDTKVLQGSSVRLAALRGEAGTFVMWLGCDRTLGMACFVDMPYGRTVAAWFAYDFMGQWEPPPDGLFDAGRKAEIAASGASFATRGSVGCFSTAAILASRGGAAVPEASLAAGLGPAALWKVFQQSVVNCGAGYAMTVYNGVLLKIDPPDPHWQRIALSEPFAVAKVAKCPLKRGCKAYTKAAKSLAAADARLQELQEAIAVAANRYGNAVNEKSPETQAMHQATMEATSGMLADAYLQRNAASKSLAAAFRSAGIRKLVIPQKLMAASMKRVKAGTGVPKAVIDRMLRRKLIASAKDLPALVGSASPKKAKRVDLVAELARPMPIERLRTEQARLTMADVALIARGVLSEGNLDTNYAVAISEMVSSAMDCGPDAYKDLYALGALAKRWIPGERGLLLGAAANEVARHKLEADPACAAR